MSMECPICGSKNVEKHFVHETLRGDMGKNIGYEKVLYKCLDCRSEGDFFKQNTDIINNALDILKRDYVSMTLDYFIEKKISFASIERILNLPQRTLTKWKNNISQPTAAGVALLKYLRLYPWLLDVAEHNFDYNISQKIFLNNAFSILLNNISFSQNRYMEFGASPTNDERLFYIYMEKNNKPVVKTDSNNLIETNYNTIFATTSLIPFNGGIYNESELFFNMR